MFLSDDKEYVPLEFISPYSRAERYLSEMEAYLIERLNPELNKKKGAIAFVRKSVKCADSKF